jgi:OPA family glycerol-3-phosphate transporter-like MFS transporter
VSYLAVYIARNIIGAVTPKMIEDGISFDYIGQVSAVYLITYAIGQLINGAIGDWIKAKYMVAFGLMSAGIANFVFSGLAGRTDLALVAYAWTGFSLSMIYGPITKVVAESTELKYATRCSLGYTFASFFGTPAAGLLATYLTWQATFRVSSIALITMAVVSFTFFTLFERRGIVKYREHAKESGEKPKKDYRGLLKRHIVKFALIAMITGIIRTALVNFLSMYFYEHLGFSTERSTSVFSIATFIISLTTFVAVFVYERMHRNMHLCPLLFFSVSAICFVSLYFVTNPILNIIVMIMAIMSSNSSATILYSVYCPSLRDTGLVSGITGFIDFLSYASAALASLFIPTLVASVGWRNTLLVACGLMILGVTVCLPHFLKKKNI